MLNPHISAFSEVGIEIELNGVEFNLMQFNSIYFNFSLILPGFSLPS